MENKIYHDIGTKPIKQGQRIEKVSLQFFAMDHVKYRKRTLIIHSILFQDSAI